jgi:hypothetical protein
MAPELFVVHLKIQHCAAQLAPPAIALENCLSQGLV